MRSLQTRRAFAAGLSTLPLIARPSRAEAEPIRIGLGESLTGALAVIGKSGIVAMQIWAEQINASGGLLGRPVKLIYYDTQSNPANVPGLYIKLLTDTYFDSSLIINPENL